MSRGFNLFKFGAYRSRGGSVVLRPEVVGFPRTGFSLLISIIIEVYETSGSGLRGSQSSNPFFNKFEANIELDLQDMLSRFGLTNALLLNRNFLSPLGGPNWIDGDRKALCVRKYIGIKGHGDLTLITAFPFKYINSQALPHSHGPISSWLQFSGRKEVFCSIRSPAGTINSAVHSINALTSEYLQKWYSDMDVEEETYVRSELALAKLSDLKFFEAMVVPMRKSFEEVIQFKDSLRLFRWEDIISRPTEVILSVANVVGIEISFEQAAQIWKKISYKNLTQSHKHNYRPGGVNLQDHCSTLIAKHIEILLDHGFSKISKDLGVAVPEFPDETKYNSFQRRLSKSIRDRQVIEFDYDPEMFWLSFQKSNIDFSGFGFKMFEWRDHTRVERTNIQNEELVSEISDIFEDYMSRLVNYDVVNDAL